MDEEIAADISYVRIDRTQDRSGAGTSKYLSQRDGALPHKSLIFCNYI